MIVTKDELCTGCGVCADACGQGCITIKYDSDGFFKSYIDSEKCINCKRCINVCPANNPNNKNEILRAYKARREDSCAIMESSSGGVAALLSEMVIKGGGIVSGCAFDENLVLKHTIENELFEIDKFKGSKYIQSTTAGIYKSLKKELANGKTALFIGTPCQVSALTNYLRKNYDNLYTIDLICHGVGSRKILDKYLDKYGKRGEKIKDIKFREKKDGYKYKGRDNLRIILEKGIKEISSSSGIVLWFAASLSLRESCYRCNFVSNKRCSDITLADYIGTDLSPEDKKYGVSMVFLNTEKGIKLFEKIEKKAHTEEKSVNESISKYARINSTKKVPGKRKQFFKDLDKLTVEQLEGKYTLKKISPNKVFLKVKAIAKRIKKITR